MGQLGTLLWKNAQFVKQHKFKTLQFFFYPILMVVGLKTLILEEDIKNIQNCAYESKSLPPSHPVLMVRRAVEYCIMYALQLRGLACSRDEQCTNRSTGYRRVPVQDAIADMKRPHTDELEGFMCAGTTINSFRPYFS